MNGSIAILLSALSILALSACNGKPCENPIDRDRGGTAQEAADKMRPFLHEMIDSQNYVRMGFKTVEEVKRIEIGKPISRIRLRCDLIKTYDSTQGGNLDPMIMSEEEIFPLLVDGKVRSTMTVDSIPEPAGSSKLDWITVSVGNAPLGAMIDTSLEGISMRSKVPRAAFSLVEIPALRMSFFKHHSESDAAMFHVKGVGSPCWPDSLSESVPLSVVLKTLSTCAYLDQVCGDKAVPLKREQPQVEPKPKPKRAAK